MSNNSIGNGQSSFNPKNPSSNPKNKKPSIADSVDNLLELHKIQGVLLGHLKKEVNRNK